MARGAIALAREQLDPSNVELATLAELAKVSGSGEALNIELALRMNDIFDKLHFPCPAVSRGPPLAFRDDAAAQLPYRNSGSQSVMPGQMYMNTRQMTTMIMYGIMPAKIWFSVTCLGPLPFK